MNKYALLIVGPVVILIVAVASYFLYFKKNLPTLNIPGTGTVTYKGEKKTLKELFDSDQTQKCTFADNAGTTGVVYLTTGKLRADFMSSVGTATLVSHIFTDGSDAYTWTDVAKSGFIVPFSEISGLENPSGNNTTAKNQKPLYDCGSWTLDPAIFVIPDVGFEKYKTQDDLNLETGGEITDESDCSICNQSDEESKQKCRVNLGCI